MTTAARTAILGRLRQARASARLPRAEAPAAAAPLLRTSGECLERFLLEAGQLGIDCHVEPTAGDVRARVAALAAGLTVVSWNPEHLPYDAAHVVSGAILGSAPREAQAAATVGLTGCDAAIAETASLALFSAPGRSRAVSLLPPVHLAIVRRDQFCYTMAEFLARNRERFDDRASCTFITGPSRTADIELTLTLGIHGPGRVAVVIGP